MSFPLISLTTDFGLSDHFVGVMKGVILGIAPRARLVDITHEITPFNVGEAAFVISQAWRYFPKRTIHVAVVDPGVGSQRRPLLVECGGQVFVGPDNGVFSWVCEREENWRALHLTKDRFFRHPVSKTFHGRDIFAPVAAALSNGIPSDEFGDQVSDIVWLESLKPETEDDGRIKGRVIHIDRFGNCITNLTREDFAGSEATAPTKLIVDAREITSFREFFSDFGKDAEPFCVIGSAGFLEIAARNSSAAALLDVHRGDLVIVTP